MANQPVAQILQQAYPVMPVLVIEDLQQALPLAEALLAGGMQVLEITLRSHAALDAISLLRQQLPELLIGAGTLVSCHQLEQAHAAGAQFGVSPGFAPQLCQQAKELQMPYLPGVFTPGEAMQALALGYEQLKLFPADLRLLQALYGPLPQLGFCPTGGINHNNLAEFLRLPNVLCCGGSWLVPDALIKDKNWQQIKQLSEQVNLEYRGKNAI